MADAEQTEPLTAIGLMSGTSLDGVDAAVLKTDGERILETGASVTLPMPEDLRAGLRDLMDRAHHTEDPIQDQLARDLAGLHAQAINHLAGIEGWPMERLGDVVNVIGFHGQTIFHDPGNGITLQIGDAALLADRVGVPVVHDFRSNDVAHGGEGAPFAPAYHAALLRGAGIPLPAGVVNLGGVANITWIGPGEDDLIAFDTGPASALIDDWMRRHAGKPRDDGGEAAAAGTISPRHLETLMDNAYFTAPPPKSLDRNAFDTSHLEGLSVEDGAATLTAFTVQALARARDHLPSAPANWYVCGGGRHNRFMMAELARVLGGHVQPVEALGHDGDMIEAQAFALLAVRHLRGLPLSFPGTTGCPTPLRGGVLVRPS